MQNSARSVLEVFMLANTPGYLYRHMRADDAVVNLSREPLDQLVKRLMAVSAKANPTSLQLASAYAALVAMTLRSDVNWDALAASLSGTPLHWAEEIISIHRAKEIPTQTVLVRPTLIHPSARPQISQNASTSAVTIEVTSR